MTSESISLPDYIRPVPTSMSRDDVDYLRRKGAFSIPEPQLRDQCLLGYLRNVHPVYPLVDFNTVQSIVGGTSNSNEKMSLLLLQALIFAGSTWADVRLVRRSGYLTRKALRQELHQRIRLLYDADYELDRLCLVQSLTLWSFWWKGPNEHKDPWHWLVVAQSIARTIDLHKPASDPAMPPALKRLRRRVWSSLVTREIISCFGLSRAPTCREYKHQTPNLCLDDFDFTEPGPGVLDTFPPQSVTQARLFARICIEHTKLIRIFGKILREACPEGAAGRTPVLYTSQQMEGVESTLRGQVDADSLRACEGELLQWRQQLSEDIWHVGPLPLNMSEWEQSEYSLKAYLSMMFHTALMTLHRPQMLPLRTVPAQPTPSSHKDEDPSRTAVRCAANNITDICKDLYNADMVTQLLGTCISCLMPATITIVFDTFSDDYAVRSAASQRLDDCRAMIHEFSEQQFAASWVLQTIDHILERARQQNTQLLVSSTGQYANGSAYHMSGSTEHRRQENMDAATQRDCPAGQDSNTESSMAFPTPVQEMQPATNHAGQLFEFPVHTQNSTAANYSLDTLSAQVMPDDMLYTDALEEMWSEFVWGASDVFPGSLLTNGNF